MQRLNVDERGELLGEFHSGDKLLTINQKGELQLIGTELTTHFDEDMIVLEKHDPNKPISAIYFDGNKECYFVKRFLAEQTDNKYSIITNHKDSVLELISTDWLPVVKIVFVKEKGKDRKEKTINLKEFISVKGSKALGNKLTNKKVKEINTLEPLEYIPVQKEIIEPDGEVIEVKEKKSTDKPNISDEGSQQITLEL